MKLTVGCLAYFDSFFGMVPAKVKSISGRSGVPSVSQVVVLVVTSNHYDAYKKGEEITTNGIHAVPRKAHYYSACGLGRIKAYTVESADNPPPETGIHFDLTAY